MDSIPSSYLFFILFLCLVLSAFFSSSETGLLSLNRYKLKSDKEKNVSGAKSANKILKSTDNFLVFVLIFNNLVNIIASSLATILGMRFFGDAGIALATGLLTLVLLVFAEIIPKTFASLNPTIISYKFGPIIALLMTIFKPIIWLVNLITTSIMSLLGIKKKNQEIKISADELKILINETEESKVDKNHKNMLSSILDLEEVTIEDIMVPRNLIAAINIDDDVKSIMRQLNHASHSRLVAYRDTLDDGVIGILRVREAYRLMLETNEFTKETLVRALDEAIYIYEGTTLTKQLIKFKKDKDFFSIVVDEYGSITGIVTLEDILEEIVGNYSNNTTSSFDDEVEEISKGTYVIEGSADLRDLNKLYGWSLYHEEARTINGLLLEHFQDIPKAGAELTVGHLVIKVLDVGNNMVNNVEIIDLNIQK